MSSRWVRSRNGRSSTAARELGDSLLVEAEVELHLGPIVDGLGAQLLEADGVGPGPVLDVVTLERRAGPQRQRLVEDLQPARGWRPVAVRRPQQCLEARRVDGGVPHVQAIAAVAQGDRFDITERRPQARHVRLDRVLRVGR